MRVLFGKPGVMPRNKMVMCFSDTQAESRVKQQDVMFQYMPEPFKSMARSKGCKVNGANIKYGGKKTGFTDDSFLTPGESLCRYLFYSQPSDSHEGVPVDALWLTEVKHAEFVTGQRRGLADTKGFMLVDFTPIWGYSPAVRLAMNGAREVMSSPCFWLPEDGGEWLTAAQVMERALKNGWSDEFVDQLLGKPEEQSAQTGGGQAGKSGLPIPWGTIYQAQTPLSQQLGIYKDFRHLYEVVTTFSKGINKFGVPGIYVTEWSYFIEEAACEKKLFESGHDTMPFRYGQRECVNLSTTDSRGTTFAGTSAQNLLKMYTDLHGAAAQLSTVPPFTVPDSALDGEIIISPLAQNKMARGRTIDPIKFPEAQANLEAQRIVERRFNRHVGLLDEDVNANETMVVTQEEIDNFLNPLRDAWSMVLADIS